MMPLQSSTDDSAIDTAIDRVRSGDTTAFTVVIRRYERPLRAWLATHAPPLVDVDEVSQRTFVAAFTRLTEYQRHSDFAAWLFTIARFQLRTELTRLKRIADYHTRYAPELFQRELERRSAEPSEHQSTRLRHLRACLQALGGHLRRFITWRYEEGIPLDEMAARSGRSVPAVKKQLWQLRRKLHECIAKRSAAEGETS